MLVQLIGWLRDSRAAALVIDCETGPVVPGRAMILARELGAACIALDDLGAPGFASQIDRRLEAS